MSVAEGKATAAVLPLIDLLHTLCPQPLLDKGRLGIYLALAMVSLIEEVVEGGGGVPGCTSLLLLERVARPELPTRTAADSMRPNDM
jgi:hypothetical protein